MIKSSHLHEKLWPNAKKNKNYGKERGKSSQNSTIFNYLKSLMDWAIIQSATNTSIQAWNCQKLRRAVSISKKIRFFIYSFIFIYIFKIKNKFRYTNCSEWKPRGCNRWFSRIGFGFDRDNIQRWAIYLHCPH